MSKKEIKDKRKVIGDILKNNNMFYDYSVDSNGIIEITVENGDWKHDHIRLKNLMFQMNYAFFGRLISDEESGDDSFSAVYLYF
jgi:hypothetical protein